MMRKWIIRWLRLDERYIPRFKADRANDALANWKVARDIYDTFDLGDDEGSRFDVLAKLRRLSTSKVEGIQGSGDLSSDRVFTVRKSLSAEKGEGRVVINGRDMQDSPREPIFFSGSVSSIDEAFRESPEVEADRLAAIARLRALQAKRPLIAVHQFQSAWKPRSYRDLSRLLPPVSRKRRSAER